MSIKLKPYAELIALSKEKLDEAMAPIRARKFRAQAELEMSKLETDILEKETKVQELLVEKEPSLPKVLDMLDEIALLVRRKEQYDEVLEQLFPSKSKG